MLTSERILSPFLSETAVRQRASESLYELHHLVGRHSTTGDSIRDYHKQHSVKWQIPSTGVTPLHVAVFRNSYHVLSVLQALLEIEPSLREMPMLDGNLPLHIYLQHAMTMDRKVLQLLLTPDNALSQHGDRPITLLYHNVLRFQWARNWELYDLPPRHDTQQSWLTIISPQQFLEYALLLLQTGDVYTMCQSPECPPLVLRILFKKLDDRVLQERYPFLLHAAAQATASCRPPRWHEGTPWPTLISYLLQRVDQQRTTRDHRHQRLPLHYALQHSTNESDMKQLVTVSYDVIDPVTQLPPALLYASSRTTEDEVNLDWLYELVRSYPVVCLPCS
ncbi:hypothetical protein FisN_19Hh057 [Fistulifera solaris]|jgi:hypothetical protein|uniref:Uncharacterized protein n=1 Tax=Fistulifera solaris TaxID=1519565 RepID=A0A1Z5K039_FISSO|nr:hypothetical protein FisN_19Hh057 [Fistulifera solaris]|eukprot:GAX19482.1 hypothetical protein FisN_19Hh057 [Fistulifera solaris]